MNIENREFSVKKIQFLLQELGQRLEAKGISGTIYLVGGAAMALSVDTRRVTDDIDAIFEPYEVMETVIASMAKQYELKPHWLNSAARPYAMARSDAQATTFETKGLSISTASPRFLLAMKMVAYRQQDLDDLSLLFKTLGISTKEEAVDMVWQVYGDYAETIGGGKRDDFLLRGQGILDLIDLIDRKSKTALIPSNKNTKSTSTDAISPRCYVCGHILRSSKSIQAGLGPKCARGRSRY